MLVAAIAVSSLVSAQVKAYKDIYFGMSKSEAKSVFKKDKEAYTNAQIGSYLYRIYTQNFVYDEKGEVFQIALTAKGGGLYGILESEAMDRLRDLVRFANANGYTTDGVSVGASEFEFNKNAEYLFISPKKDKFMKLVFVPSPSSDLVYCTLWTGLYDEKVVEASYKSSDF